MKHVIIAALSLAALSHSSFAEEQQGTDQSKMPGLDMDKKDMPMKGMDMKSMQDMHMKCMGMMGMDAKGDQGPSSKAFNEANTKMHQSMTMAYTGDADVDFVKGMIPHHQGAIDMAKIVLQYGKDPETKKLAEDVIKAQEGEIAMMQDWLAKHGK
jgi:uncharacterized protein (DUF305 family)